MLILPDEIAAIVAPFAPHFSKSVFEHAKVLLVGGILTNGRRTVCAALRTMGLADEEHFQNYHRVLNRAQWSGRQAAHVLLLLLLTQLPLSDEPLVFGIDETIERRWGRKLSARAIYRDPVRSSQSHFVKASGLRWVVLMLLVPLPWSERVWALPVLTVLAPSERSHQERGQRHRKVTDWAQRMLAQLRRWLPLRRIVVVADASSAKLTLLARCQQFRNPVTVVVRGRVDMALYEPAPPPSGRPGRPRKKGARLPAPQAALDDPHTRWETVTLPNWYGESRRTVEYTSGTGVWYSSGKPVVPGRWVLVRDPEERFEPQCLWCTDPETDPVQIIRWFIQRWSLEVTFEEARRHLGVESQRQWSDLAIARTTPALLALFSLVTLMAHQLSSQGHLFLRQAAWYVKEHATFSDALALVRQRLWPAANFALSPQQHDLQKTPPPVRELLQRLTELACYAP